MQANPIEEWQRLAEHYRTMTDGELEELAYDFADLTETAQQVLRIELKNRGLGDPLAPDNAPGSPDRVPAQRWVSSVDPDHGSEPSNASADEEDDSPRAYTWKTLFCECDDFGQAWQIREALKRAGIESWIELPGSRYATGLSSPRVLVAADQLDQAIEIARQPIPQDIVEQTGEEVPEFKAPKCPRCGTEDPVLEDAEATNAWLCEACGHQWTEPEAKMTVEAEKSGLAAP